MSDKLLSGWTLSEEPNSNTFGEDVSIDVLDSDGFSVAEIACSPILHDWHKKFPDMNHWADGAEAGLTERHRSAQDLASLASLFVAAPDMLEALKSAVASLEQFVKLNRIPENNKGLRDARAAIAKAGGR